MLDLSIRDKWFIGALYAVPLAVLGAALFMAFFHAKDWAGRHDTGDAWQHWAFAAMIELPALFGILLMALWPKIGGNRKPTVPRLLFLTAAGLSQYVQQAYAGPDASASARFVAGLPSFAAMIFIEIVFWVMGLIDAAKKAMAEEDIEQARQDTRQTLGLGDIAPPPDLTPPVMSGATQHDMSTTTPDAMSPDIDHDTRPDMSAPAPGHDTPTPTGQAPDIAQVKPHVWPGHQDGRPWVDLPDIDPDTEAAEQVLPYPDVLTSEGPDIATGHDTGPDMDQDDTDPDVRQTADADADTEDDTTPDTTPKWQVHPLGPKAADMRRSGATLKTIAEQLGKSERTISRWGLPEPEDTKPVNGHDLTGANR